MALDAKWEKRFKELQAYKEEHGDCIVPQSHPKLGQWVRTQRNLFRNGQKGKSNGLRSDRKQKLENIGFSWDARDQWNEHFKELQAYKEEHGDCLVPYNHPQLGRWVAAQRTHYREYKKRYPDPGKIACKKLYFCMSQERIDLLEKLGFEWYGHSDEQFKQWVEDLLAFKEEHGDCLVPYNYNHPQLGGWVAAQRMYYKRYMENKPKKIERRKMLHGISRERIEMLEEIGFHFILPEAPVYYAQFHNEESKKADRELAKRVRQRVIEKVKETRSKRRKLTVDNIKGKEKELKELGLHDLFHHLIRQEAIRDHPTQPPARVSNVATMPGSCDVAQQDSKIAASSSRGDGHSRRAHSPSGPPMRANAPPPNAKDPSRGSVVADQQPIAACHQPERSPSHTSGERLVEDVSSHGRARDVLQVAFTSRKRARREHSAVEDVQQARRPREDSAVEDVQQARRPLSTEGGYQDLRRGKRTRTHAAGGNAAMTNLREVQLFVETMLAKANGQSLSVLELVREMNLPYDAPVHESTSNLSEVIVEILERRGGGQDVEVEGDIYMYESSDSSDTNASSLHDESSEELVLRE